MRAAGGVVSVALAVACAACGGADPAGAPPPETAPRPIDCGSYSYDAMRSTPAPPHERAMGQCLLDAARTGRPATLTVEWGTIEGDPITERYTVEGRGRILLIHDASKDRYGGDIERLRCEAVELDDRGYIRTAEPECQLEPE